ncbi:hypothetical protein SGCZBJ_02135 [Caulobacter zeae]|uniref:Pentapeptide repeat-containing protein n=1 Tax=Caulobacter zeae TaxID=2055137 RepID=A0A2N5DR64_9CAUL|nr:pentapeptide repeat-containing protein [Caulobacter zeae]PLR28547.1 hypothetical protein SGCZBJ_02135 [Caulobacter zeae]
MDAQITESQLLARYRRGERVFSNLDIVADGSDALESAVLDGVEMRGCCLAVSLRGTSLRRSGMRCNLKTCDFTGADLTGADFRDAALCATTFKGAKMEGARFAGAFFHSYSLADGETPDW